MALRFGVNLVMYALTGNYKSDQVHVPAILERLGPMSGDGFSLAASPLLPWWAIAAARRRSRLLAARLWRVRGARGAGWRLMALAVLLAALVDPSLVEEQREPQRDVAVVVVDDSPSMRIGERRQASRGGARGACKQRLGQRARSRRARGPCRRARSRRLADNGTELYTALTRALSDVPRQRVAGAS